MMPPLLRPMLAAMVFAVGLSAQQPNRCPADWAGHGDLGIARVRCVGGTASCRINDHDSTGTLTHHFSVEPEVVRVTAGSGLRVGDVLVAVDSLLITTSEGGRRLASVAGGSTVQLLVRRGGRLRELELVAGRGCGITSLNVTRSGTP